MSEKIIIKELQKKIAQLESQVIDYEQTCGLLCEECGWRMVIPDVGCLNCLYQDLIEDDDLSEIQEILNQNNVH